MSTLETTCKSATALGEEAGAAKRPGTPAKRIRVFMMDLWCFVPYYEGYLCKSLRHANVDVTVGAITHHLDHGHFARQGLRNDPGLLDIVARLRIRNPHLRRILKFVEFAINSAALAVRFAVAPPDILHVQYVPLVGKGLPFEFWLMKFAKRCGIKIVHTVHDVLPHDTGDRLKTAYRPVYLLADALICHNQLARTRLIEEFGIEPERIWLVPHGPMFHDGQKVTKEEARGRLGYPPGQTIVLWQGIVLPYKGIDFLLEAWQRINSSSLNARLIIAGGGEERWLQGVREKVRELGIEESVGLELRFLSVEEVALYYQAADLVAYPYKAITTSGALMTGLSYRKPLVATNLPSFRELLRDGENAALVEYGDVQGLAEILGRLIRNPDERNRLTEGLAATDAVSDSWAPIACETRKCYEAVL